MITGSLKYFTYEAEGFLFTCYFFKRCWSLSVEFVEAVISAQNYFRTDVGFLTDSIIL